MTNRIGYACINLQIPGVQVNRDLKKSSLQKSDWLDTISKKAFDNVVDFEKIVKWNVQNGILFYRISSSMFPWWSQYRLDSLKHWKAILTTLQRIGNFAREHGHRFDYHPGPFTILASPNEKVVYDAVVELEKHTQILHAMGYDSKSEEKINFHIGGTWGSKDEAIKRFVSNMKLLSTECSKMITIENDDKDSQWSVKELIPIHEATGIPIVFDNLHHEHCTGGLTAEEAAKLAVSTWNTKPLFHWSDSGKLWEGTDTISRSHSYWIWRNIETFGLDVDVMVETKGKDIALQDYFKNGPRGTQLLS